ncbi:MAG: hypothetical protein J6T99_01540 [Oscillospiraceae bacterium]|nr:hypothetical protein [Oscillospiraceae bacterium]
MKKLTGLFLVLCMVFCLLAGSTSAAAETGWQEAYRSVLDELVRDRDPQYRNDVAIESSYLLYDVDKDGTPELIMKTGTCEADYKGTFYTFRDGAAVKVDEFGMGHSSLYSDPGENGIILHNGHMGYAFGARFSLVDGQLAYEDIFEDNLNSRLQEDEDAEYIPVENFVPGACYLTLCDAELDLPITQYEEIRQALDGEFPKPTELRWPKDDAEFYVKVITENRTVYAVPTDRFANQPGQIGFQDLLKKDVAAQWMSGDLQILGAQPADLNGDGKLEGVLELAEDGSGSRICIYLSEQDGEVYAYLQNYAPEAIAVDGNGNLLMTYFYSMDLQRLFFDGDECLLIRLPMTSYSEE